MNLILLGIDPQLCEAWRTSFAGIEPLQIYNGRFSDQIGSFDCFVSPANSFGLMDGGLDAAIIDFFGVALEARVQDEIWRCYRGEQPVGTCLIVPTGDPRCPWLAHCPTMRVPMDVAWTNHAYAAFLAALTTSEAHGCKALACAGLGTGVGRLPAAVAARQMRYAYDLWKGPQQRMNWEMTGEREIKSSGRSKLELLQHKFGQDLD